MNHIDDKISRTPDVTGPRGCAWEVDLAATRRRADGRDDATVATWVIERPWAHPVWHSYALVLIHLRPLRTGDRAPAIYVAGATHELWLYAMAADVPREPFIAGAGLPTFLTPLNFGAQIIERSDADAVARCLRAVQEVCDGTLNPDTDFVRDWVARFGDNMMKSGGGRQYVATPGDGRAN